MINKECFTTEWIAQKSIELKYNDKNLIEKVIRAFSLLEMLAASGCPFHFKGGTSLMLILGDGSHRLSIDVDIMCPPGTNIEDYLKDYAQSGFLEYQERMYQRVIQSFSIRWLSKASLTQRLSSYWMSYMRIATITRPIPLTS